MVKVRVCVKRDLHDGDKIELPENALALSIQSQPTREMITVVTWLEEVKE